MLLAFFFLLKYHAPVRKNARKIGRPRVEEVFKRKKISITLPAQLLMQVMEHRKATGESASEFIAESIRQHLKHGQEANHSDYRLNDMPTRYQAKKLKVREGEFPSSGKR
jgi:Arc/MetJ-type ribon-helix-helix transcriptional regulator